MLSPFQALEPPATLGVIGGGQLGRMFVQAAQRLGFRTVTLAPTAESPAAQIAHDRVIAPPDHLAALQEFAKRVDGVTVEFENVSAPALRWLDRGRPVRPGWRTVWVSQNRLREKTFLRQNAFPHAPWRPVLAPGDLPAAGQALGFPLILKTTSSGYDGKGQARVDHPGDLDAAWAGLGRASCVAEGWVSFAAEISVVVARGVDARAVCYPAAQNRHRRHILDSTEMPAAVGPVVARDAQALALAVAQALGTVGVLTVEFFLTETGGLVINELAPRPHNSGHLTIEAAVTSQFEQQVRALCGWPLGSADLVSPAAMVNLLGDLWAKGEPNWQAALARDPGVKVHLYGKRTPAPGRKMGHLTVLDPNSENALARVYEARRLLTARP